MATKQWGVWCEVWGGVTGRRESWLKSNGVEQVFDSEEAAEAAAEKCRTSLSAHRTANFKYTAERYP